MLAVENSIKRRLGARPAADNRRQRIEPGVDQGRRRRDFGR
jgi:hypothetical protein